MVEKKKFFEIELPVLNEKISLLANSEEELEGRTIKLDLTRRLKGKSMELTFRIIKKKAEPCRLSLLGYFIRRMMRKGINYVEDSFSAECKDAVLRIKPFLIARKKVSRAVRNALRNKAKEEIQKEIAGKNLEEIFSELISNRFQKDLSLKLKKIYPLALCEIRDIFSEKKK